MNKGVLRGLTAPPTLDYWPGPEMFGSRVIYVGGPESGAQYTDIQAVVENINDSSVTKPYTLLHIGGTIDTGAGPYDGITLDGMSYGSSKKDYIGLIGLNRDTSILRRLASGSVNDPVIQPCDHSWLANLTITSPASRLIHWDRQAGATLSVDNVSMPAGGGGNGLSCGVTGTGSRLEVSNCYIGSAGIGCHGGAGSATDYATLIFRGNTADFSAGNWLGLDLSASSNSMRLYLHGNAGRIFNVDYSHRVQYVLTEGAANRIITYTDFMAGMFFQNQSGVTKFWNRIFFPQMGWYQSTTATAEGDVVAITMGAGGTDKQGQVGRVTAADTAFPAVVVDQEDTTGTSGWSPRIATGPYAEVTCETAGAVAVGDILVTSATSGAAKVNNAQTDAAKILGWAMTTKAGATAGRVVVKLSAAARSW